jgi:hypothetical protein
LANEEGSVLKHMGFVALAGILTLDAVVAAGLECGSPQVIRKVKESLKIEFVTNPRPIGYEPNTGKYECVGEIKGTAIFGFNITPPVSFVLQPLPSGQGLIYFESDPAGLVVER